MSKRETPRPVDRAATVSELFVAHHRRLIGLAALLVDDRGGAEEVVQEAFLNLHRQWRLLRDPSAAAATSTGAWWTAAAGGCARAADSPCWFPA